ncbi:hypothetical protein BS50DRAFT_574827 [Corynespora cassiicola Philippines]|uniref:Uncharacterized protein n=1 Tax=Corynespora cassiicola Philippines TaxID=1448308 RepID=A0A2T2NLZ0_CORCC|nr:hypothetical protein BS50DRAFT_574827 [Corynespora cassiicola Philippines]
MADALVPPANLPTAKTKISSTYRCETPTRPPTGPLYHCICERSLPSSTYQSHLITAAETGRPSPKNKRLCMHRTAPTQSSGGNAHIPPRRNLPTPSHVPHPPRFLAPCCCWALTYKCGSVEGSMRAEMGKGPPLATQAKPEALTFWAFQCSLDPRASFANARSPGGASCFGWAAACTHKAGQDISGPPNGSRTAAF